MSEMNRRYLKRRPDRDGGTWYVVYNVPKPYQGKHGLPREIVRTLGTKDVKEAMSRKHPKLLEIQADAHRLVNGNRKDTFSLMAAAREMARDRRGMDPYGRDVDGLDLQIADRAESIADRDGSSSRAHRFADVAFGRATPISVAAEEWRAERRGIAGRTRDKYERVLETFQEHFGDCAIDTITRRKGIEYLKHLRETPSKRTGKPRSDKSIKDDNVTLASFYKVCIRLGLLPLTHENPFEKILGGYLSKFRTW